MAEQTLYSFKLNYHNELALSRQLLPIARKFLSMEDYLTNEWNYKNTYTDSAGLATEPELKFFVDHLKELAYAYLTKENFKLAETVKLSVSIFASAMKDGDQHAAHQHPGSLLSGLIYLSVPKDSAKLEFRNPRHNVVWLNFVKSVEPVVTHGPITYNNVDHDIIVEPSEGLLLLWESWAYHRVPVNRSKEERVTLVFNIGVEDAN